MRRLPLLVTYLAYPLSAHASRLLGLDFFRNWIDPLWFLLGFAGLLVLLRRRVLPASPSGAFLSACLLSLLACLAVLKFGPPLASGDAAAVPWLMELKPLFYLGCALAWFAAFGAPSRPSFIGFGLLLALIVLAEFAALSIMRGQISRPLGSGEVNYDACLLLISLAAWMTGPRRNSLAASLMVAAAAATFSRTAAAAMVLMFLFAPGLRPWLRASCSLAACLLLALVFYERGTPAADLASLDRYWMWLCGAELLSGNPLAVLAGFSPGAALPLAAPPAIEALWSLQREAWSLSGLHAYNFHSFWLRLAITWGPALPCLAAVPAGALILRRGGSAVVLAVLCLVMGMSMGLFYLSNVAVPLVLAWLAAFFPEPGEAA
jgi:hypothetical protein